MPGFKVIVADPPWSFGDKLTMSEVKRGAESNYQGVLDVDALCRLPVQSIAADDAVLALWFVSSQPAAGLRVMEAWGFRQTQVWTWVKLTSKSGPVQPGKLPEPGAKLHFGMGRIARGCTENLYIGVRGKLYQHVMDNSQRNVFFGPALGHSAKPEALQDILDTIFPMREGVIDRVELFARRERLGWLVTGNEIEGPFGCDVRDAVSSLAIPASLIP